MADYLCPVCGKEMPRDLMVFLNHTDQHIVNEIKKTHPQWVDADGVCRRCLEFYRRQLRK